MEIEDIHKRNEELVKKHNLKEGDFLRDRYKNVVRKIKKIHPIYYWVIVDNINTQEAEKILEQTEKLKDNDYLNLEQFKGHIDKDYYNIKGFYDDYGTPVIQLKAVVREDNFIGFRIYEINSFKGYFWFE